MTSTSSANACLFLDSCWIHCGARQPECMSKPVQRDPKAPIDRLNRLTGSVNPPKYTDRAEHVFFHIWLFVLAAQLNGYSIWYNGLHWLLNSLTVPPTFHLAGENRLCLFIHHCDSKFPSHITEVNANIHS